MVGCLLLAGVVLGVGLRLFAEQAHAHPETSFVEDSPGEHYQLAIEQRDWAKVAYWIVVMQFLSVEPVYVWMALIAGIAWLVFLLQAGQVRFRCERPLLLMLLAFIAGIASTWLTHAVIVVQEELYGFGWHDSDLSRGMLYFFTVGLREELCKLIGFMPFVPILLRAPHNRLPMLMVAGAVGLGFAAAENISYYASGFGVALPVRFLTANFFHIAATGLCGYAFCQIFTNHRHGLQDFFTTFAVVVAIHGLYNSLLVLPQLDGFELFATAVYILMCYQFFQVMHQWRSLGSEPISLTANFLFVLSSVVAMVLCLQIAQMGLMEAIRVLSPELLGSVLLVILFIREINEPLQP